VNYGGPQGQNTTQFLFQNKTIFFRTQKCFSEHNNVFQNTTRFSDTQQQTETHATKIGETTKLQSTACMVTSPDAESDWNLELVGVTWSPSRLCAFSAMFCHSSGLTVVVVGEYFCMETGKVAPRYTSVCKISRIFGTVSSLFQKILLSNLAMLLILLKMLFPAVSANFRYPLYM